MTKTKAEKESQRRYEAKCRHFMIRLRLDKDEDIIKWLSFQSSANERLKELIRDDINSGRIEKASA
jgi:hypothetical protein